MTNHTIGIIGATGAVGQKILTVLNERNFAPKNLRLFASARSAGKEIKYQNKSYFVEDLSQADFSGIDVAFFSAGTEISQKYAPIVAKAGAIVIDNSNAHRMIDDIPLVVPEVNPEEIKKHKGIIANPNCSTIQMLVALAPIHRANPIKRIVVSTYQSVSGTGTQAIDALKQQCEAYLKGEKMPEGVYPHPIGFNLFPHIDIFLESGLCREEAKMVQETHKILSPSIKICPTTVRLPIINCHSESINLELENPASPEEIRQILSEAENIVIMDEPEKNIYPTPLLCEHKDEVFVGRIRKDPTINNGINLWVVTDNLRTGAATNAVKIYEKAIEYELL